MDLWIPERAGREAIGELPRGVTVRLRPRDGEPPPEILGAEFLVLASDDGATRALLARMAGLRVIQTLSAGVDWLAGGVPDGVTLCDARGTRDATVAEWVLAAVLAAGRRLPELRDQQREHRWRPLRPRELAGSTVVILGAGSIGEAVAARLQPFGVRLIRVARRARPGVHAVGELDVLLPGADVVIVLLPLTPATDGLLGEHQLSLLPDGALLVNAARGRIVDAGALLRELEAGRIRAVLDVTDPEPLPREHPLWDAPGVMITPHLAGDGRSGDRRAFELAGEQVRRYCAGRALLNVVEAGY